MSLVEISVRDEIKKARGALSDFANRQVPYAAAMALTALSKKVQEAEVRNMVGVFDRPTPFTLRSVGVKAARKSDLQAVVYVKDIAAAYLEPFEFGGTHKLIGKGKTWLNPKNDLPLNQYGNLTKNKLAQLKGRSDVFVGKVKTKSGQIIDGVWQRPHYRENTKIRGMSRKHGLIDSLSNTSNRGRLKLLIRFGNAMPVKQHLNYRDRAQQILSANFDKEFGKALAKAMATAKR